MSYSLNAYYKHEHGDNPVVISTMDEVDALLDALLQEPLEENSIAALYIRERTPLASGFPDHELRVAVNAEGKVGGLRYTGSDGTNDGTWYAKGAPSQRDDVWYCYMGHDEDYPTGSELPIEDIRTAAKEFLEGGGERPSSPTWRDWPEGLG